MSVIGMHAGRRQANSMFGVWVVRDTNRDQDVSWKGVETELKTDSYHQSESCELISALYWSDCRGAVTCEARRRGS